jgi:hypothetical protein
VGKGKRLREQRAAASGGSVTNELVCIADDPAVHDCVLKLRRSYAHLEDVKGKIGLYLDAANETFTTDPDPDRPGHVRGWVTADKPARDPFSLLIGDCLQNLRTSLDQIAFELNTGRTSHATQDIEKRSEFPIFGEDSPTDTGHDRFHRCHVKGGKIGTPVPTSGLAKTEGMDSAAQKIIEKLQPYYRGNAYDTDPLWRIHELNRIDKHRSLHAAVGFSGGPQLHVEPTDGPDFQRALSEGGFRGILDVRHGNVDGRTQIGAWPAGSTPEGKKLSAALGPRLTFTFEESVPLVGGEDVIEVLVALYNYVVTDVFPPLIGYL